MSAQGKQNSRSLGRRYEEIAAVYLQKTGYRIIQKNFYCRQGEIDIIARQEDSSCLVFLEVKYRGRIRNGLPEEAVLPAKRRKIVAAARYFLSCHKYPEEVFCRFDVIGISGGCLRHYQNAFDERGRSCCAETSVLQLTQIQES